MAYADDLEEALRLAGHQIQKIMAIAKDIERRSCGVAVAERQKEFDHSDDVVNQLISAQSYIGGYVLMMDRLSTYDHDHLQEVLEILRK